MTFVKFLGIAWPERTKRAALLRSVDMGSDGREAKRSASIERAQVQPSLCRIDALGRFRHPALSGAPKTK